MKTLLVSTLALFLFSISAAADEIIILGKVTAFDQKQVTILNRGNEFQFPRSLLPKGTHLTMDSEIGVPMTRQQLKTLVKVKKKLRVTQIEPDFDE